MRYSALAALILVNASFPVHVHAQTYTGRIGADSSGVLSKLGMANGTVVVGLALSDGLVLAADSRLTLSVPSTRPGYKIVSDAASKLFNIGSIGIATFGEAFLLGRSINSFVSEYDVTLKDKKPTTVEVVAEQFSAFFGKYYDQHVQSNKSKPSVGFIFAGYDKNSVGRLMEVNFPGKRKPSNLDNDTHENQGAVWRGQIDVISRLIKGFDPSLGSLSTLTGLDENQRKKFTAELAGLQYWIPFDYLMLQDGIDLALTLVQATVDMQRFSFGTHASQGAVPGVGGYVDVIAVTPSGLTWVKKKSLSAKSNE
jgi:Proteasome subunit